MMNKKLILIDGHALFHRAFHALPPFRSPKGDVVNAVYGFLSVLLKTIKDVEPEYIVATFDLAAKTFRHKEYADYKGHREVAPDEMHNQLPIIKQVLAVFGIPVYEAEGYEADDVIGTIAEKVKALGDIQVIILTGDLDTLQLVDGKKVVVSTPKKGVSDAVLYDDKAVMQRFGLRTDQMIDYKGLRGDPSDNIPGVPGVGEKTATTLLKKYETIEKLYDALEKDETKEISPKMKVKLLENKEKAFFSKKLVTIVRDVELDFDINDSQWQEKYIAEDVENLTKELGFFSVSDRLPHIGAKKAEVAPDLSIVEKLDIKKVKGSFAFHIVGDFIYIALDSEKVYKTNIETMKPLFEDPKLEKIGHNIKPAVKKLLDGRVKPVGPYFDTEIAAYLITAGRRDYSLERVYFAEFAKSLPIDNRVFAANIWELKQSVYSKLERDNLVNVSKDIEMPLIEVLAEMERKGIKIDLKALERLSRVVDKEIESLKKEIYSLAGEEFNISSPKQLGEVLFNKMNIKGRVKKTSGGAFSTAASELEKLKDENEIIDFILKYRELQKLKTTYIDPFPSLVGKDGRLHTTYLQTVAATGRLASADPNLQNIPIRTKLGQEFRGSFVADKGYKLLAFDYSQFELRILAHISEDKKLVKAFKDGDDIHLKTASEAFGVKLDEVTPNMRRQAKVLNFGIIYGMGSRGFAQAAGVDTRKAKEFIDRYFEEFDGVAEYIESTKEKAHKEGYVETIFGRRRELPDIQSSMPMMVNQAERVAVNLPIQGTQADLMKLAMIKVYDYINEKYSEKDVKMLLQIHDELVYEIKEDMADEVAEEIKKIMETTYKLNVPTIVEVKKGDNWSDMKKLSF